MADCKKTYDDKNNITIMIVSGETFAGEIIQWLREFYDVYSSPNLLWDFLAADLSGISDEDIAEILKIAKQYSPRRPDGKTALVVHKAADIIKARNYDYFSSIDNVNLNIAIFETRQEALNWLAA